MSILKCKKGDWLVNSRSDCRDFEKVKIVKWVDYDQNIIAVSNGVHYHPYLVDVRHANFIDRMLNALRWFGLLRWVRKTFRV